MATYSPIGSDAAAGAKAEMRPADSNSSPVLRYHKRAIILLVLYIPLIIIPWVATCILAERPISGHPYLYQRGLSGFEISSIQSWITAINVLNSIASLTTVPILSALIAQAAVVYSQRRVARQNLSVRQLFALADRGWADVTILFNSWRWNEPGAGAWRVFLYSATGLLLISAIQQPLNQLLVPFDPFVVTTCSDTSYITAKGYHASSCWSIESQVPVGADIEPFQLAVIPQNLVTLKLIPELATASVDAAQSRLWPDYDSVGKLSTFGYNVNALAYAKWYFDMTMDTEKDFYQAREMVPTFVASLPINTTTGVLRQHTMRLNSSAQCNEIDRSQFPGTCPGARPFNASFAYQGEVTEMNVRVCVPGEWGRSPWTLSRNRQDIGEVMYLDMRHKATDGTRVGMYFRDLDSTIQCVSNTTRGYFELGNSRNNQTYGPLIQTWPTPEEMLDNFNDFFSYTYGLIPSESDPPQDLLADYFTMKSDMGFGAYNMSGPLMTTALALFGNDSWFKAAENYSASLDFNTSEDGDKSLGFQRVCSLMPFSRLQQFAVDKDSAAYGGFPGCPSSTFVWGSGTSYSGLISDQTMTVGRLVDLLNQWLRGWNTTRDAQRALSTSLFLANQAGFTMDADTDQGDQVGRTIYSSDGITISKPKVSLLAKIVLSLLIALQVFGLILLTYFIYRLPTWTTALNALAVARVGKSLDDDLLPGIGTTSEKDTERLKDISGVIGVAEERDVSGNRSMSSEESIKSRANRLQLGALGVIRKGTIIDRR